MMKRLKIILAFMIILYCLVLKAETTYRDTIEVSGQQSGLWSGDNIYHVVGSIEVSCGSQLTIEPGAIVKFMNNYNLIIQGILLAEGTETDSIIFTSGQIDPDREDWTKIELTDSGASGSLFKHCLVEYSNLGISLYNGARVEITHCNFQNNHWALRVLNSRPLVEDNLFQNNHCAVSVHTNTQDFVMTNNILNDNEIGLYMDDYVTAHIEGNIFKNHQYHAAFCHCMSPVFIHNIFEDNNVAIVADGTSTITQQNTFDGCSTVIDCRDTPQQLLVNNTIVNCSFVITHDVNSHNTSLINNILAGNNTVFYGTEDNLSFSNNLFWDNQQSIVNQVDGLGIITTENYNGDDCDIFNNIFENPHFVNEIDGNYHLENISAAIDAGVDDYAYLDPDGSINDCGAYYYTQGAQLVHAEFDASVYFEEPFTNIQFINLSSGSFSSCLWDFGDGEVSNELNPQHAYDTAGVYTVGLTIMGEGGTESIMKTEFIEIMPQQEISGMISGSLTGNTAYLVSGDLILGEGEALTIEPGCCLRFAGNHRFIVQGYLIASGTAENKIRFISSRKQPLERDWAGIYFNNSHGNTNNLSHVVIKHSQQAVYSESSLVRMTHCKLSANNVALEAFEDSYLEMSYCQVTDSFTNALLLYNGATGEINDSFFSNDHESIFMYASASLPSPEFVIENNTFENHNDYAIITCSESEITANTFYDYDCAVRVTGNGNQIHHNLFMNGSLAICLQGNQNNQIYNNTIANNQMGIAVDDYSENPDIINNIFTGNENALLLTSYSDDIYNNLFFDNVYNSVNNTPSWFGICDQTNLNGDACDQGYNLFQSAGLIDPQNADYGLTPYSCCINAGNPDPFYNDPDGSISDIGAFYFLPLPSEDSEIIDPSVFSAYNYPNPFNPETTITFFINMPESKADMDIFNVKGQLVYSQKLNNLNRGINQFTWNGIYNNGALAASGVYYYSLTCGSEKNKGKMILLK